MKSDLGSFLGIGTLALFATSWDMCIFFSFTEWFSQEATIVDALMLIIISIVFRWAFPVLPLMSTHGEERRIGHLCLTQHDNIQQAWLHIVFYTLHSMFVHQHLCIFIYVKSSETEPTSVASKKAIVRMGQKMIWECKVHEFSNHWFDVCQNVLVEPT